MTIRKRLLSLLVPAALALAAAAPASSQEVTALSVEAAPSSHSGHCPVVITFTAKITLSKPGRRPISG